MVLTPVLIKLLHTKGMSNIFDDLSPTKQII